MSKIKMQFDVPKKVNTDIYSVRELCNTVFTRARMDGGPTSSTPGYFTAKS